jgi:PAS domain S-box-containing protein
MVDSHHQLLGRALASSPPGSELGAWLYEVAPFCLLAHDGGEDPRFVYANQTAQRCFGYAWSELVGLPSRLSALPDAREERAALLASVAKNGFAEGYRGLRVTKSGQHFWIEDVTVWNVLDVRGRPIGQAATYARTTAADPPGRTVAPVPGQ